MANRRFRSKIDTWLVLVGLAGIAVAGVAMAFAAFEDPVSLSAVLALILVLATCALIASMFLCTWYDIDGNLLTIRSGPFCWRVPIDAIDSVKPTRSPLSSPALSLDRLDIRYGRRRIMVSPADKRGFLKAIGHDPDGRS